jgi:phenylalanyl-tRNA synthetase alpha chain
MFNLDKNLILQELTACHDSASIKEFYMTYLSKTGSITWAYKQMGSLAPEQKKEAGQFLSSLFQEVETAFYSKQDAIKASERDAKLREEVIDWSIPSNKLDEGGLSLQNQLRRRVEEIFANMWFHIHYGHDVVNQFENFTSVNIPTTHPATEMHDTIYIDTSNESVNQKLLLRTHTSCMQNTLIKKYTAWKEQKSCKFIVPGKVYRYEDLDATHDCVFWQIEGVVIDKNISIAHFKSMIEQILKAMLETDEVEFRMRPAFFPFTEPGFEIDAKQVINGKTKRIESLGAGMIHPNVLEQAGVDPKEYSGFAFGMGMSRLVAIKNKIHDIRLFTNGDLRFAKSFTTSNINI